MGETLQIAILGSGNVGGALGKLWTAKGHTVTFGVRDPHKSRPNIGSGVAVTTAAEAVAKSAIVVLSVPWPAAQQVTQSAGKLDGKILIDTNNPVSPDLKGLTLGTDTSAAELIAGWAPAAHVVKAFNTIGAPSLGNAKFGSETADGFYCGDNADAKKTVHQLIADVDLNPVDVGPLKNARLLEPLALLWIDLAINQGQGINHAFKLLRR